MLSKKCGRAYGFDGWEEIFGKSRPNQWLGFLDIKGELKSMKCTFLYWKACRKVLGFAVVVIAAMALQFGSAFAQSNKLVQSGTLTINQVQVAWIFSGNVGGGKLRYGGRTYPFSIGGLGVGGFGVSKIEGFGEVYNLRRLSDFDGAYGQARAGIVVADLSKGSLWLENPQGVYIRLTAKRKGIALALGLDAIYIKFD
jgi:hypothetical protein